MRLTLSLVLLSIGIGPPPVRAQAPPVGPLVLRVPATPRTAALGNAWVAGRDEDVLFYNPAQLIGARQSLNLSITRHGRDATMTSIGSVFAAGKWSLTLGWGVQLLDFSPRADASYPFTTDDLLTSGSADGFSSLVSVGGAIVFKGFRIGAAGKYASDRSSIPLGPGNVPPRSHGAFLADIGVARNLLGGVGALSVQNLGRRSLDADTDADRTIPRRMLPGWSFHRPAADADRTIPRQVLLGWSSVRPAGPLDVAVFSQLTLRDDWTAPGAGIELGYGWIEGYNVALRAGIRRTESTMERPFSLGAAFTADRLTVEYGVQFFEGGRAANGVTIRWR